MVRDCAMPNVTLMNTSTFGIRAGVFEINNEQVICVGYDSLFVGGGTELRYLISRNEVVLPNCVAGSIILSGGSGCCRDVSPVVWGSKALCRGGQVACWLDKAVVDFSYQRVLSRSRLSSMVFYSAVDAGYDTGQMSQKVTRRVAQPLHENPA